MKKVRVIRDYLRSGLKAGDILDATKYTCFMVVLGMPVSFEEAIANGWLEEVADEKPLWKKLKECHQGEPYYNYEKMAKIAMTHAVEVAQKAADEWINKRLVGVSQVYYIVEALKKECEGI